MSYTSSHLSLPYLAPAQAQKHVTHNDALRALDILVQLSVISDDLTQMPADPQEGQRYIISSAPLGEWSDRAEYIAAYQDTAWHYFAPQTGWQCYVQARGESLIFDGQNWQMNASNSEVSSGINGTPFIGVNAEADPVNRLAVKSDAALLSHDLAGSHQLKINKAGPADTASLVLQSAYTGHAEIGLTADNDLHVKVSSDGAQWGDALVANTRGITTPLGLYPDLYLDGVDAAGGNQIVTGAPNVITIAIDREVQSLQAGRVYFSAFYVDRPTRYRGAVGAMTKASADSSSLVRAGLYYLGVPNGNSWAVGQRIVDLGTKSAEMPGHIDFGLNAPITLSAGWYVHAVGTDGSGVSFRAVKWYTPGQTRYLAYGSGASADLRVAGASRFFYDNAGAALIVSGYPLDWPDTTLTDVASVNTHTPHMLIPRWEMWD